MLYMCFIYFEAGLQKFINGEGLWLRQENFSLILLTRPNLPSLGMWVAKNEWVAGFLAYMGCLIELFAPFALINSYYKAFFGIGLALFHVATVHIIGQDGEFLTHTYCFAFWVPWSKLVSHDRFSKLKILLMKDFSLQNKKA